VVQGKSQGAAGTVEIGFAIANSGPEPCILDGYPTIGLVPNSGTVAPVVSHSGQGSIFSIPQAAINLAVSSTPTAGFALEYSDVQTNGETSCPQINDIDVTLPGLGGSFTFAKRFFPCGAPNVSVSAIVTGAQYKAAFP
jgi:hypothetical protein